MTNQRGMTMLEVLIAVALLAVMFMTTTEMTTSLFDQQAESTDVQRQNQAITLATQKIYRDLSVAFHAEATMNGNSGYYKTGFRGDAGSILFSSMSHDHVQANDIDAVPVWIKYSVAERPTGQVLLRAQTRNLSVNQDMIADGFVLLNRIKDIRFSYYDANKREWVAQWNTESISALGMLPQMIRVDLLVTLVDTDKNESWDMPYRMTVPVFMSAKKISL